MNVSYAIIDGTFGNFYIVNAQTGAKVRKYPYLTTKAAIADAEVLGYVVSA